MPFAKIAKIAVRTASVSCKTSLFQNLKTRYPILFKYAVRLRSWSSFSACCPPSTSMTTFFSTQMKSTIKGPTGYCRLNFLPPSPRLRRCPRQSSLSASVIRCRKVLASCHGHLRHPSPQPSPLAGERGKSRSFSPSYRLSSRATFSPTIVVGRVSRAMGVSSTGIDGAWDAPYEKLSKCRVGTAHHIKGRRAVPALPFWLLVAPTPIWEQVIKAPAQAKACGYLEERPPKLAPDP